MGRDCSWEPFPDSRNQSSCCQLPLMLVSSVSALARSCLEREEEVRQRWFCAMHLCSNHENIQSGSKQESVRKGWHCTDLQKYFALRLLLHFSRAMHFQLPVAHSLFYWQNNVSYSIPRLVWFLMGQCHYLPKWISRFCLSALWPQPIMWENAESILYRIKRKLGNWNEILFEVP